MPENVATPPDAVTVREPPRDAPPGLPGASDTVTGPLKLDARLPNASSAVTARPNPAPSFTLDGGAVVSKSCARRLRGYLTLMRRLVVIAAPVVPPSSP